MKEKVIIVGAGVSGLYLAYLLQDKFEVTILEARDRIGGRIFSIDTHDMGPSWVWSHHIQTLSLLKEHNLELFRQYNKGYAIYDSKDKVELFTPQPSAISFRVKGSLTALVNALKEKLNVNLLLSQKVQKIEHLQEGLKVSTISDNFFSDYVICALAPRLTAKLNFHPQLPNSLLNTMLQTQTWMGNSMKCVIEFKEVFWREKGLSGFMFSHKGPIAEMHDACTEDKAALFGFVHSSVSIETFEEDVFKQMQRVFNVTREDILNIHFVDWKQEKFSASLDDAKPLSTHPQYGIDTTSYSERVYFSSTEFSFEEGGYIEGAIINAQKVASKLLNH